MEDIRFVPSSHGALLNLNKHRKRLLYTINLICVIAIIPFALLAFVQSYTWLGICLLGFVTTLVINTMSVLRTGQEYFHHLIVMSFLIAALTLAVYHKGIESVFWVFPVIATSIFVLPMRAALFFTITLTSSISTLMFLQMESGIAIRASAALGITIAIYFVVVNIIQELQEKLRKNSEEDPLTGLSNRRQLDGELIAALNSYKESGNSSVILLLDIDSFKSINDSFGHDNGDRVIKMIANAIDANTEKPDAAFRLGGDEFLILLKNTDCAEGKPIAEKIREDVEKLSELEPFQISVSIGASEVYAGASKSSWLKQADTAMYQAKKSGRNCIYFAESTD